MNSFTNSGEYTIQTDYEHPKLKRKNNNDYTILNLAVNNIEPSFFDSEENTTGLQKYYSVILDKSTLKPLSIAPPLPSSLQTFTSVNPIFTDDIQMVDMVEGTFIHLFFNHETNEWEIATKGSIGGNNWHYRTEYNGYTLQPQKTFRQMFYDAIMNCCLVGTSQERLYDDAGIKCICYDDVMPDYNSPLSINPFISQLDKGYCYGFILKHPSNPIVHVSFIPKVTLISAQKFTPTEINNEYIVSCVSPSDFETIIPPLFKRIIASQNIRSLDYHRNMSITDILREYQFIGNIPGVMFVNTKTGERTVHENALYVYMKELRGNHPNLQFQYFELKRNNRLGEFIKVFPGFSKLFQQFQIQYMDFVCAIHYAYVTHYIHHHDNIAHNLHKHILKIHHNIYKPSLARGERIVITLDVVLSYFNNMTPSQLVYIMNNDA